MAQEDYYASHRFVFVGGELYKDCVKWPDFKQDMQTTEVATDERYVFPIQTGMTKLEALEFEFNRSKAKDSAHIPIEAWKKSGGVKQVTIIETDSAGDPFDPKSIVAEWDLGKCQLGPTMYPGGEKPQPVAGKVVLSILPRRLAQRTI